MKLSGLKYLADQGVENIWKNKMMAFATFCVVLISLLLVGTASLFYINMNSMILGLNEKNEIAVYLDLGSTKDQIQKAEEEIKAIPNVNTIEYISKEEAFERQKANLSSADKIFSERIGNDASFMPDGFSITVKNNDMIADTTAEIGALKNVLKAKSSLQVAEFLKELRRVVTLVTGAIVIALATVSMIMISNTTKASVYARREEIRIMKYVGATNSFIRLPFFVEGMVTGLFAGIGAFFITWGVYNSVYKVILGQESLMNAFGFGNIIPFKDIIFYVLISYLLIGAIIGALGSVISTKRHIDV